MEIQLPFVQHHMYLLYMMKQLVLIGLEGQRGKNI